MPSTLLDVVNHAPDGHEFKVVGVGGLVLDGGDVGNHGLDRRFGTCTWSTLDCRSGTYARSTHHFQKMVSLSHY